MDGGFFIYPPEDVLNILQKFIMEHCKPCATPYLLGMKLTKECDSLKYDVILYQPLVGILIYITHNRPDRSFVVYCGFFKWLNVFSSGNVNYGIL
jgi:hypothetical protein